MESLSDQKKKKKLSKSYKGILQPNKGICATGKVALACLPFPGVLASLRGVGLPGQEGHQDWKQTGECQVWLWALSAKLSI